MLGQKVRHLSKKKSRVGWLSLNTETVLVSKKKCLANHSVLAWPFYLLWNMKFTTGSFSRKSGMAQQVLARKPESVSSAHSRVGNTISCPFW